LEPSDSFDGFECFGLFEEESPDEDPDFSEVLGFASVGAESPPSELALESDPFDLESVAYQPEPLKTTPRG
jgi:hypothetical protein